MATKKPIQPITKPKKNKVLKSKMPLNFPIVGIGASAGGLEALGQFFKHLPEGNGMAFVIIQHLDPNYVGMMPELLQRTTTMKVFQVTDNLKLEPNCVYVIPPNKSMSILNGVLHLFSIVKIKGLRLPIDYFFSSLADDKLNKSIGIILSGMGSDGSMGIKAIKDKKGIVLVQDPKDAKFDGMPISALNACIPDAIASASELPDKLMALNKYRPTIKAKPENEIKTKGNLDKIIILIRNHTGHNLSLYKRNTLFRRVERRMAANQFNTIANYLRYLQENPNELDLLFKDILIGVTSFFRDTAVWLLLKDKIFPELFDQFPSGYVFRAWVPACSTGEEAYTLAIVFKEALEKISGLKHFNLQIFATDIDKDAITFARKSVYSTKSTLQVTPEQLRLFFTKVDEGFHVNASIREMIVFAPHDVIKDPPFRKLDFLSCRNLLIYLEPELQKKLMSLFYYSLNPSGIMLLGSAENADSLKGVFTVIDTKLKFFKRSLIPVPIEKLSFPVNYLGKSPETIDLVKKTKTIESVQTSADQLVLQRFAPASLLINPNGDILYIYGNAGKYLEIVSGKADMNIYNMAPEGLITFIRSAIRKASQHYQPIILNGLKIVVHGGAQYINIKVQNIEKPDTLKGFLIIIFTDVAAILKPSIKTLEIVKKTSTNHLQELETELQRANEELQTTREEMQTSQEELKSINEELQSSNEELQSTNEELITSKEEMQSLNEELQTVNMELQSKVSDFEQANNDMKNLLNSTEIATLFLDNNLNIRRFTESLTTIFMLRPSDIGRPFTDLVSHLEYSDIKKDALEVLRTLVFKEITIKASKQRWFKIRIMPYRSNNDRIEGLVMTFIDISVAKKTESLLATDNIVEIKKIATALAVANKELAYQNEQIEKRAAELVPANKELAFQNEQKEKRAAELVIIKKKLET
jgi:two-component system CheB/CheR fusion protein